MIDNSILQSNFIGRDGFRWWIGEIAPKDSSDGKWGNREKVRILGYHPFNEKDLANKDLPWAICMLPTTSGTGAANISSSTKLRPGDRVIGFFMDGDNGQIPMIIGSLGRTSEVSTNDYVAPFVPYTGFNDKIPRGTSVTPDETSEQGNPKTQPTPTGQGAYCAIGDNIIFADTCTDSAVKTISSEISNLLKKVANTATFVSNLPNEIRKTVDKITSIANHLVGKMFNYLYTELKGLLKSGLKALYESVFAKVLASTSSPVLAHEAGVLAQQAMAIPVQNLEKAIPCVASKIVNGLSGTVQDLVESLVENVSFFVTCAAEQFVGALLNTIVDAITDNLGPLLNAASKILSPLFSAADLLRSTADSITYYADLFDCNQDKSKCSNLIKNWKIGAGNKQTEDEDKVLDKIINGMNIASGLRNDIQTKYEEWDVFTTKDGKNMSPYGGCYTGEPTSCGAPEVRIFGGGGTGALGKAILGSFVSNTPGLNDAINQTAYTASIIGVTIENPGSGYKYPPFVEFVDNCNKGYGAIGRAVINDKGQVTSIYMVSVGENYVPNIENPSSSVTKVYVKTPGSNYSNSDTATDNLGNEYKLTVVNGNIIAATTTKRNTSPVINDIPRLKIKTSTGFGAVLVPILGNYEEPQNEVVKYVDCID